MKENLQRYNKKMKYRIKTSKIYTIFNKKKNKQNKNNINYNTNYNYFKNL